MTITEAVTNVMGYVDPVPDTPLCAALRTMRNILLQYVPAGR